MILAQWILPLKLLSQNNLDTIYFNNGEKLIGEIKKADLGILTFDSDAFGIMNIKMYKIKTLKAHTNNIRLETTNKKLYFGYIDSSNETGTICFITGGQKEKILIRNIFLINTFKTGFINQLEGNVSGGFTFTRSSGI